MKYRKKPVVVEAVLWDGKAETLAGIVSFVLPRRATLPLDTAKLTIETLEGNMIAEVGDMIIKGVNGECYPCKPDIFEKTYESPNDPVEKDLERKNLFNRIAYLENHVIYCLKIGAIELVQKAFHLSVCDLPDEEQEKLWKEFVAENKNHFDQFKEKK